MGKAGPTMPRSTTGLQLGSLSWGFWPGFVCRRQAPWPGQPGFHPAPLLPTVESAGFPQPTMADFRMTFPEAEVNQPSQPPLSIFSLGGGKGYKFYCPQLYTDACSHIPALGGHSGVGSGLNLKPSNLTWHHLPSGSPSTLLALSLGLDFAQPQVLRL